MESWGCPAFWLARSGVLAAYTPIIPHLIKSETLLPPLSFSAGKGTALIIDIGATNVSITPVHDGLILKKGVQHSHLGGNFVSNQIRHMLFTSSPPIALTPHYLISSKTAVEANTPPQAKLRSFSPPFQESRILTEFKECVVRVWPGPGKLSGHNPQGGTNADYATQIAGTPFEFPDGYNQVFNKERYTPAEPMFDAKAADPSAPGPAAQPSQTLPALLHASLSQVDVDARPAMLGNVVVVGGGSLLQGCTSRIDDELKNMYPGTRIRVHAAGNSAERRFSSWVGGSILASLGTFHQMWISKKEYEEHGVGIVEKRCK